MKRPELWIIVPCYNEEDVLPKTAPLFAAQLDDMAKAGLISPSSRILFVDDGSTDSTWEFIRAASKRDRRFCGIRQSRNRGHQNAILAGLMEAKDCCDITISIDCDGQDDITAMTRMVEAYSSGSEVVYGVRSNRDTDTGFKRGTARGFYRFMRRMGVDTVYDHADYRLISSKVLKHLAEFREVNLFLRGIIPLVGFQSSEVRYERSGRVAGKSHYPLGKMMALAVDGITSMSIRPVAIVAAVGIAVSLIGAIGVIWAVVMAIIGRTVPGWASTVCIVCFLGGLQMLSLGVIGIYVGKTYLETKRRPRYIISERCGNLPKNNENDKII